MTSLTYTLLLGFAAASAVVLFRALPPGKQLAATGKKPWACDICMSFWSTYLMALIDALVALGAGHDTSVWRIIWSALPAYIVCLWLVKQTAEVDFPFQKADTDKEDKHV
jgi:hypothetical protein